uniref:Uncharacterized protein n=1 Tax=viral metagenome TaxID=1070528 RepID=A0A6M3J619_9ZZZZ
MASELRKKITGGSGSANTVAVGAGFDTGFIFNNDGSNNATITFADGSTYIIAPSEIFHFPFNSIGYEAISVVSAGTIKYAFTNIGANSIVKT